jgi:hypothetical protein
MITGLEPIAIKWAAGHIAHALAAKGLFVAHHPVSAATNMAGHHAVTSLIGNLPQATNPLYVPVLNHAVLSNGTAGTTGVTASSATPARILHDLAKVALPVVTYAAWQQVRKSGSYRDAKDALSGFLDEAMAALSDRLANGEPATPGSTCR